MPQIVARQAQKQVDPNKKKTECSTLLFARVAFGFNVSLCVPSKWLKLQVLQSGLAGNAGDAWLYSNQFRSRQASEVSVH